LAAVPSIGRATGVEGTAAPEADATRTLYERYGNQIFGYCLHQLGAREEAEDAVQSTFLNAFRGLSRGVVPEAEQAWLFKIAQNVCLSRRRSSWRRGRIESPTDFELAEETTAAPHRRADELIGLQDVLETMPENQRRAILLREWQGLSYREIAEELELSQAAVETLIFRARRALAAGLETSPAEQRSLRARIRSSLDVGSLVAWAKSFLASGVAVKAAGTAAVVTVASAVAAMPQEHTNPRATSKPARAPAHARKPASSPPLSFASRPTRPVVVATSTKPVATHNQEHAARPLKLAAPKASPPHAPATAQPATPPAPAPPPAQVVEAAPQAPAAPVETSRPDQAPAADETHAHGAGHGRAGDGGKRQDHGSATATSTQQSGHEGGGARRDRSAQAADEPQQQRARNHGADARGKPASAPAAVRQQQPQGQVAGSTDQGEQGHGHRHDQQGQVAGTPSGGGHDNVVGQTPTTPATATATAPTPTTTTIAPAAPETPPAPVDESRSGDGGGRHGH
jgi:RNA polymerase sigma factor (sigma-70 family)